MPLKFNCLPKIPLLLEPLLLLLLLMVLLLLITCSLSSQRESKNVSASSMRGSCVRRHHCLHQPVKQLAFCGARVAVAEPFSSQGEDVALFSPRCGVHATCGCINPTLYPPTLG